VVTSTSKDARRAQARGAGSVEFTPYSPDMEFTDIGYPVFDCDFHFYETA
jgi:hypothetical protein